MKGVWEVLGTDQQAFRLAALLLSSQLGQPSSFQSVGTVCGACFPPALGV